MIIKSFNFRGLIIFLFGLSTHVQSDAINFERSTLHRLPKNVSPASYELWLYPHLKSNNFAYEGRVIINFTVLANTNFITLNAAGLNILKEKSGLFRGSDSIDILSQDLDEVRQFYVISLGGTIINGRYSLRLDFTGEIRDQLFGFYRSAIREGNRTRYDGC